MDFFSMPLNNANDDLMTGFLNNFNQLLNQTQEPYTKQYHAKLLNKELKNRLKICLDDCKRLLTYYEELIPQMLEQNDSEEDIELILEESGKISNFYYRLKDLGKQRIIISYQQAKEISEIELEIYRIIVEPVRENIINEEKRKRETKQKLSDLMNELENKYDRGEEEDDIKIYVFEKLCEIYPKLSSDKIKILQTTIYNTVTAHKPKIVKLKKSQIEKIKTHDYKDVANQDNKLCVICQEDFENEDKVRHLPCDHIYHENCIDTWFNKNVHCPLCKKDIREFLN